MENDFKTLVTLENLNAVDDDNMKRIYERKTIFFHAIQAIQHLQEQKEQIDNLQLSFFIILH